MQDILDSGIISTEPNKGFSSEDKGSDQCFEYFQQFIIGALHQSRFIILNAQKDVEDKKQELDAHVKAEKQTVSDSSISPQLYTRVQTDTKLVSKRIGSWIWGMTICEHEPVYEYFRTDSYSAPAMSKGLVDAIWHIKNPVAN